MGSARHLSVVLCIVAILTFSMTLGHGFLNWDDPEYVTDNPLLSQPGGLARIWSGFDNPQVYPMVFSSFWLEHRLWGDHPAGYHAVNLLLHALACLLLFRLLLRMGIPLPLAFCAALAFAVHPTQTASVAWISERKNVLSGVFYFASLIQYVRAIREGSRSRWLLSLLLATLALLSKSTTVTLPATLLLLELWEAGRVGKAALFRLAPFGGLVLASAALTVFREHGPRVVSDVGLLDRWLIAGRAVWFYAGKLLAPLNLSGVYHRWDVGGSRGIGILSWIAILGIGAALGAFGGRLRDSGRAPGRLGAIPFGLAQFALALLPTLGIIPFGYMEKSFVADHFLYLPSWGFWLAFFSLFALAVRDPSLSGARFRAVPLVLTMLLVPLTILYARSWQDSGTFWGRVLSKDPVSWIAYGNRGQWHAASGRLEPALDDLRQAVRLRPGYQEAWFNLGYTLDRMGRTAGAEDAYRTTLRLSPSFPEAHVNLGILYLRSGDLRRARVELETAARLLPGDPDVARSLRVLEAAERRKVP